MEIHVDSRGSGEATVYDLLCASQERHGAVVKRCALDVGDYLILDSDGKPAVCVERKTHADMAGSLRTNHHVQEQVCRLKALRATHRDLSVFIVYEGTISKNWHEGSNGGISNMNADMYLTCLASRDGLLVHSTSGPEHTARWLEGMILKERKGTLRCRDGRGAPVALAQCNAAQRTRYTKGVLGVSGGACRRRCE